MLSLATPLKPHPLSHSSPLHHRSALTLVFCTLQVTSYGHGSRAKQQRGIGNEGTCPATPRGASGYGTKNVRSPSHTKGPGLDGRERATLGRATEICISHIRFRLWIGMFQYAHQAVLAYDVAMFCFYGERLPSQCKFIFPAVQRPIIP